MTPIEAGLVVAVALLTVVAFALARAVVSTTRRLEVLERRSRREQRSSPQLVPEGDAVDIRGAGPDGDPVVVPLEANAAPTLLAFLSTSCTMCVGHWERLRAGELAAAAPGVVPVIVTKDAAVEDPERIRALTGPGLQVVLSSEAWHDYEVPASPYVMIVSSAPGSVVTEGAVRRWEDIVTMAASATTGEPTR